MHNVIPQANPTTPDVGDGAAIAALDKLLRSDPESLDAYFGRIAASVNLPSTKATVHCHHLRLDGNKMPRVEGLADRLARELINYAIPKSEIQKAKISDGNKDTKHITALYRKANRLFTDLKKTGEGGELLLYLMAETYLGIPQLLCKMPLKTSPDMHFHGSDGIYGTYDVVKDSLAIYWGESKLFSNPSKAIKACFESLAPFVMPDGSSTAPQSRDLHLLKDNLDLNSQDLETAILRYLDPDDVNFLKLSYRGIALVGFDTDSYSSGGSPVTEPEVVASLNSSIDSWHQSTAHYVEKHKMAEIELEIFCVPFPSVEDFRHAFLSELGIK